MVIYHGSALEEHLSDSWCWTVPGWRLGDSASVELSDVLISVIILSLTVIFLSVYPRNEPVC